MYVQIKVIYKQSTGITYPGFWDEDYSMSTQPAGSQCKIEYFHIWHIDRYGRYC